MLELKRLAAHAIAIAWLGLALFDTSVSARQELAANGTYELIEVEDQAPGDPESGPDAEAQAIHDERGGERAAPPHEFAHAQTGIAGPPAPQITPAASERKLLGPASNKLDSPSFKVAGDVATESGWLELQSNQAVQTCGALAVVIGLALFVRVLTKRLWRGGVAARPSGVLEILARYPLGRGQQLIILKFARRIVLLHQSGSAMTSLCDMHDPDEVAGVLARMESGSSQRAGAKFRAALAEFQNQHDLQTGKANALPAGSASPDEPEVIDLTRSPMRGIGRLFGRRVMR